jgi:calcium-dependent protein kinase
LDIDGNGTLSLEELKVGLAGREDAFSLMDILKNADTDDSGEIDYSEFIAATIDQNIYLNEVYLKQAFNMFDTDNSGQIDASEVSALIKGMGNQFVEEEAIAQAIAEIDEDGDGQIDFGEFLEMMKNAAKSDL